MGIAAEMMPRLFTLFSQAAPALERSEGGLGIGLSLVRGLVELHGGTVSAHSRGAGQGSEFVVRLPIGDPADTGDGRGTGLPASAGTRPLRLLVADDNRDSAQTCAALLQTSGHEVSIAHTGREAFDLACRRRPLLIAISGWGQDEDKQRALAAGFDRHLTKPIDPNDLETLLQSVGTGQSDRDGC